MKLATLALVPLIAAAASAQPPGKAKPKATQPAKGLEGVKSRRDIAYVPDGHAQQKLDLHIPEKAAKPLPLVIWVHGGAWSGGDKGGGPWQPLLAKGYAVASVNYRLSGVAPFPAQIEDCKAAVRFLRGNAAIYDLNPDRFAAWGSSAGGHLVALLGTANIKEWETVGRFRDTSSRVQAVVDWFGPTDLTRMGEQAGPTSRIDHDAPNSPESKLIGGPIRENRTRALKASPINYVAKDAPPFLIMHGDKDDTVPHGQSVLLNEALKKAGVKSTMHTVKGAGHALPGPEPLRIVVEFLDRHLKR